jgi:hypothetical protein
MENNKLRYHSKRVCDACIKGLYEEDRFGLCECLCSECYIEYKYCSCNKDYKLTIIKNMIKEAKRKEKKGIYVIFDSNIVELLDILNNSDK